MAKNLKINKHLKQRGSVYWYSRRVPKELHELLGKVRIEESLKTGDIKVARALRDEKDAELSRLQCNPIASARTAFEQAKIDLEKYRKPVPNRLSSTYIDFPLSSADMRAMGMHVEADALEALEGNESISEKYGLTLEEAVELTCKRKAGSVTDEALHRYMKAAEKFSQFLKTTPQKVILKTIDKVTAHKYVQHLEELEYKRATIQGELNRLKNLWKQASNLGHVPSENPFDGHEIVVPDSRRDNKTQLFEEDELSEIISLVNDQCRDFKLIIKILAFTGARPSEICGLTTGAFQEHDGVKVLVVKQGKTLAATRFLPLTEELIQDIGEHCNLLEPEAPLFNMSSKDVGRLFSRLKSNVIEDKESRKVMYSLRVHFATAAQRAEVREDIAAQIVGHSNAKTLTFGYYSKGYEPHILKENYDKIANYLVNRWGMKIEL